VHSLSLCILSEVVLSGLYLRIHHDIGRTICCDPLLVYRAYGELEPVVGSEVLLYIPPRISVECGSEEEGEI
jgi:hypothetical protein